MSCASIDEKDDSSTLAAAKISLTDCDISGPIPSPSIKVTVKLPYPRTTPG